MSINTIEEVHSLLDNLPMFAVQGTGAARFGLDNIRRLCEELGNPQENYPAIHVAGTNGKGITCHMLASVYRQCGYRVGLNTSPHLQRYHERFRINGEEISDQALIDLLNEAEPAIDKLKPTYFELATALAMLWFRKQKVDLAIFETGLGGRLDATNILDPVCCAITSIGMDHTDLLGNTLAQIAGEKAGIIKPGVPVVVGRLPDEAMKVIKDAARESESEIYFSDELEPAWSPDGYSLYWEGSTMKLEIPLRAPVQAINIATVAQVVRAIQQRFSVDWECFSEGLLKMDLSGLPGRFEKLHGKRDWYFDGAHNAEAVRALLETAETIRPIQESVLVLSLMKDKVQPEMMQAFSEFGKIYYYSLDSARAASYEDVKQLIPRAEPLPANSHRRTATLLAHKHALVIYAGSFYFYSTVRKWLAAMELHE